MTPEFFTQQLWRAAEQRKECKVKLKGEIFPRTIHPYGICQSARNKIVIVCWQVVGPSKSGNATGYRNLLLENCEGVEILNTGFQVQPNFSLDESTYKDWVFHI